MPSNIIRNGLFDLTVAHGITGGVVDAVVMWYRLVLVVYSS